MYGYGLFETIKVYNGKIYFFKEHMERLKRGCEILNLELKIPLNIIEEYCYKLIRKNNLNDGGIRVAYSKNKDKYCLLITTRGNIYKEEIYKKGFKLCFADIKRNPESPLVRIKSNNYIENILSLEKARKKGFDEAVFENVYGKICEGTISNIFFIKDNVVYTPSVSCGILPGIIRNKVMNIVKKLNLKLKTGQYHKDDLFNADEIFITNSLLDVMPVNQLEYKKFNLKRNFITRLLMEELKKLYR
ncbi:hypothetical protein BBF96_07210 [Anoxybacter fermentans]|uniref:4-amino-4-deoxychorismate lyase n=2 Tax=Anoxybacter fermentans TaxID=1323375 RepID=A0A3Q9HT71_9FIRM|nr:hypothetical protein BBF96_07210 [Anoxybacter fermentans]